MKYAHILLAVAGETWAMERCKLLALIDFLALQASGIKFSADDVEARIAPARAAAVARKEGSVAILPLRGIIANRVNLLTDISGGTSAEAFALAAKTAGNDDGIKAVVIDVDSPGGVVSGVEEAAAAVASIRGKKPVIAQVNAKCASAAYWIASAADEVVITPSGEAGSIGCMVIHEEISKALEEAGITRTLVASSQFKGELEEHLQLSEEARAHLQSRVDAADDLFVNRVADGRSLTAAAVREKFGQGRMLPAKQALAIGMVDRIATMDETLARFGVSLTPAIADQPPRRFAMAREQRALALR